MGRVVATNASFTVMLLYLVGIQKAASVGSVSPTVPTQMARPTVTGEIPVASAMGPTMDTVVSMATVADPTAARMIIPSTKARRITGMFTLENSSTRASPRPLACRTVPKQLPQPITIRILPTLSETLSM